MSELIPNLEDLRAQLPTDGTAHDTHQFIEALELAASAEDVAANIDTLVDRWMELPDDHM